MNSDTNQERTDYTVNRRQFEESLKLYYDVYKHLTTLSTGAIVILVALLEKVFVNPKWRALVVAAFCFFLLTILGSLQTMMVCAHDVRYGSSARNELLVFRLWTALLCLLCFVLGVLSLVVFATKNLYQ
jgi:hypothetical protein